MVSQTLKTVCLCVLLPEGYVVLCVANVVSSTETRAVADSDIHLLVSDFDLTSLQKSPKWLDKPSVSA